MDRDKILAEAKKNSRRGKEYEDNIASRGDLLGLLAAFIVYVLLSLIEYINKGTYNMGATAVILSACGTQCLYEGIKMKHIISIIAGSILTIGAVITILIVLGQVMA